ncbi:MAG: hypothetical protein LH615_04155 [Ferruginibacter sp.]|nr:hypothetical protein [Ferruginibacter sp.]
MTQDKRIKPALLYLGWILFFAVLWLKGCGNSVNDKSLVTQITIPEITKTLPVDTLIIHKNIKIPKWYKDRINEKKLSKDITEMYTRIEGYENQIEDMHNVFSKSDSIKKLELYELATKLKRFQSNFEDENLKLTINGIVGGNEIKEITPTYTIKERKVGIPIKQTKFRLLAGFGAGNTKEFNSPLFNANLGFQNAKGNVLKIGYDTEKRIMIGYDFSLFKF